jgi:hypothetical protein
MESYDLLKCIERVLDDFGSNARQSVYLNLVLRKGVPYESVLENPTIFTTVLREVFDESSVVVERAIVNEISHTFGLHLRSSSSAFEESIELACKQISG